MATHQFSIGELVTLNWQSGGLFPKDSSYTIKSQLPPVGIELQYRIKSTGEPYERVVTEHQLSKLSFRAEAGGVS